MEILDRILLLSILIIANFSVYLFAYLVIMNKLNTDLVKD